MIHELSYSFSDTRYCTPKRWKVPMWGLFGRLLLGSGAVFILLSGCIGIVSTQSTLPYKFCENENDVYCPVDDKCLLRKQKCNFHSDCSSGEDELLCGESCNFDYMWPYESTPCSGWSKPLASDGRPGFFNSSWERRPQKSAEQSHGFHLDDDLGPQKDDSTGAAYGQYALFLNRDHIPNTEATLVSPWFGSTGAQCQFNFSANMFGTNVGELKLFIRTEKHVHEKWDAFDAKGTMWLSHSVIIGEFQEPIQLYFEAIRGMGDRGHIALDSLHLSNCDQGRSIIRQCHLTEFMCEDKICIPIWYVCDGQRDCYDGEDEEVSRCEERQHPLLKCDFEYGSCNWTNSSNTEVQAWFRNSGATPSNDTGPSADHTTRTKIGHYMYYEASVEARQPIASQPKSAGMETNTFPPLYPRAFNEWSPYYGTCKVTFFYHMFGADVEHLKLLVVKHVDNSTEETELHTLHAHHMLRSGRNAWLRATISLPYIKERFNLKFVASKTWRYRSDIAVDDLSVSPECYGMGIIGTTTHDELTSKFAKDDKFETIIEIVNNSMRFSFKTCANTGAHGPTQHQCDAAYMHLDMKVDVLSAAGLAGVQVWTVPQTTMYSITALGARGGIGIRNPNPSMGAYASAKFNLTQGEKIYMLVGQQGESACSQNNKKKKEIGQICRQLTVDNGNNTQIIGGGGGGGGGTMVFKIDPVTNETIPLIIAGGGGGKSFQLRNNIGSKNPIRADGGLSASGPGNSSITPERGPGAGGGWRGTKMFNQSGMSLLEGGIGGAPCKQALEFGWEISGGFGGGGGACTAGGGGGGYTGGNVSSEDNPAHNGQGGSSYISPDGFNIRFEPGTNDDDGEVEIAYVLDCPCEFMCIYQNYAKKEFKCYCAPNNILADDGLSCLKPDDFKEKHKARNLPTGALIAIVLGGVVLLLSFCGCIFCIVHQVHKRRLQAVQLERLSSPDYQLNRLRSAVAASQGIINGMEYNPNYDFGGTKCTLQDLKEIPREHLTLIRALGQGAFGEVYQGLLSNSGDLPVAVKTLPALCTDQAEMDFLMEALIMSKFNHPNIVRFIGVCFEKHPRFIVLELLEGGDLKTFLRESRPKPDSPSRVTMLDLVKLALDVSKGCQYLEENHFIHRDIASRNCLLSSKGPERAAKIADFGMARDIYRADYYRKGGKAMLPVKWMPPEAFLDGIFTSKTDVWSFGILLWEVFSLGYMPYPGRGNQEVMQLVTAGGRLEPPQNCPSPVYHIMQLCWADIPDRRPNFGTIIEKLRNCLQDPEVIYSPLPVFQRPPSVERDTTIMRPRESDRTVLTVDPPAKYLEPDSPSSMDQLIGPVSPDYVQSLSKKPNLSASAESLDELLEKEDPRGKASADRTDRSRPYNFDSVFKYDMVGANSRTGGPRPRQERGAELGAVGGARASPTAEKKYPQHGAMFDIDNPMGSSFHGSSDMNDSGKSSIDNVSQSSVGSSQARSNGRGSSPHSGATGPGIARSRPSPKRNPNESSNLLPVATKQTKKSPNTPSPSSSRSTGQAGPNKTDSPSSAWDSQEVGKGAKKRLYENTSPQYGSLAEAKKDEAHPSYSGLPSPSSSHEHHGNGSDGEGQGDSGVVIDLKNAGSRDSSLDRATNSPV